MNGVRTKERAISTNPPRNSDTHCLGLFVENGLGLTTVTGLLSCLSIPSQPESSPTLTVISSLSLGGKRVLSLLVLGDLVGGVLSALLSLAVWTSDQVGKEV